MNVDAALEAGAQLAKGSQPGVRALNHLAVAPEPAVAFDALARDAILDACAPEMRVAARIVVPLVRMQFRGPAAWPARFTAHGRQGIDQLFEDHRIMAVGARDAEHQRDTLAVRDQVALAAELAPVRGVEPCVRAPGGWERWPHRY